MAVAMVYPAAYDKGASKSLKNSNIDGGYISRARTVLSEARVSGIRGATSCLTIIGSKFQATSIRHIGQFN
jgi:hypothetical protein